MCLRQRGCRRAACAAANGQIVGHAIAVEVRQAAQRDDAELVVGRRDIEQAHVAGVAHFVGVDDGVARIGAVGVAIDDPAVGLSHIQYGSGRQVDGVGIGVAQRAAAGGDDVGH